MFFLRELHQTVILEPSHLGKNVRDSIRLSLYRQVEGTCNGIHGYILAILSIDSVQAGVVQDSGGFITFRVRYSAIVMKPFKNETIDANIITVNKMGFFAKVGPLQVFVSNHLIPSDYRYESTTIPPSYLSDDPSNSKISPGNSVRLRIVGTRVDANAMFAIGTIKDDFLGIINP